MTSKTSPRPWSRKVVGDEVWIIDADNKAVALAAARNLTDIDLIVLAVNHFEEMRGLLDRLVNNDGLKDTIPAMRDGEQLLAKLKEAE